MPERFNPDSVVAGLRPIAAAAMSLPQEQAYRSFYGLDKLAAQQVRLGFFDAAGYRIAVQAWWPQAPKATLVLLHGYYDHTALYCHVIEWALSEGFAVLAFDLPGHGLSSGARASIGAFAEYQVVLKAALTQAAQLDLPQPWHLFGQSTGGAIVIDYLLTGNPGAEIGQAILFSPLVRPRAWGWSKLSYRALKPFVRKISRRFTENSHDADFIDFLHHRDPLQPQCLPTAWVGALIRWVPDIEATVRSPRSPLIVQGEGDMTVDWQHNLAMLDAKFSAPKVLLLPEARHHMANEAQSYRDQYFAFLTEQLHK
ncbi:alpha/beta hydrolase [Pseudomonas sp. M30-35]|uniref:alpha/beta hydrolase n=1 Tax=Pseudomonas sp. M30-35 TaxID=1981174 RepID=UPI000B3CA9C8|nr:alpha/beta hydrolase [Pseudomonas sp. M30-35]ARU86757.1 alpha/beta hydrolase [Pseudomonas sp. M30-35]